MEAKTINKSFSYQLLSLLVISISLKNVLGQENCVINQPHITLGDYFATSNSKNSNHIYTIGLISRGDCTDLREEQPVITLHQEYPKFNMEYTQLIDTQLKNSKQNNQKNLDIKPTIINDYQIKYRTTDYKRKAYFYYIDKSQIEKFSYWSVKKLQMKSTDIDEILYGPFTFPKGFENQETNVRVSIVADMDFTEHAYPTIDELKAFKPNDIDIHIHAGDMAYDIDEDDGMRGDDFFQAMHPITSKMLYTPISGNHEFMDDSALFNYRFRMPGTDIKNNRRNAWYSYDFKNVHFVSIDFDYIYRYRTDEEMKCFEWLRQDLEKNDENSSTNWLIFFTHRPFYCSDTTYAKQDCGQNFLLMRKFEVLLLKFKVDLLIGAHVHIYTRSKPFNSWETKNLSYENERAPLYIYQGLNKSEKAFPPTIVVGHSGTKHFFPQAKTAPEVYLNPSIAVCNIEFASWTELNISNKELKVITWNSGKGTKADEFTIVKGSYSPNDPRNKKKDFEKVKTLTLFEEFKYQIVIIILIILLMFTIYLKKKDQQDQRIPKSYKSEKLSVDDSIKELEQTNKTITKFTIVPNDEYVESI